MPASGDCYETGGAMTKLVRSHNRKGLAIQAVLFVLMSTAGLYGFIHSGFFALTHIEVLGAEQLKPNEVRKLAALPVGSNLWRIDEIQLIKNIKAHPKIGLFRLPGNCQEPWLFPFGKGRHLV